MTIAVVNSSESTQELANISALATPSFSFRSDVDSAKFASDIRSAMCRGTYCIMHDQPKVLFSIGENGDVLLIKCGK